MTTPTSPADTLREAATSGVVPRGVVRHDADMHHHMSIQIGANEDGSGQGRVEVDYFGDGDEIYLEVLDESVIGDQDPIRATVTLDSSAARAIAEDLLLAAEKLEQQISEATS